MSSSWWSGTRSRTSLQYKTATSNKETLSRLWVRSLLLQGTPTVMAKCFQRKTNPGSGEKEKKKQKTTTVSVCWSRLRACSASAAANNSPFLLGVNTKQLSNQMLELTKVINELKDVLIQQVTGTNGPSEAT